MDKLSIVILNWNGAKMLRQYLPGVLEHSDGHPIVVADNGSCDDSLRLLREEFPQVRTILFQQNYGFAQGYNEALRQVEAEYYLLLNNDVRTTEGWLTPLLDYMESHPHCAACQPKLRCDWATDRLEYAGACGGFIDRLGYPYCRGRIFSTVEKDEGQYDTPLPVAWASGAALLVRSSVYWEVGGLDNRFFAHQEEIDLCWRMRSRGWEIVCLPQSVIFHLGGGTLPQDSPRKTYLNFRNNLFLLYKNLPEKDLLKVFLLRFPLDVIASLTFLLKGHWGSFCAVWKGWLHFLRDKHSESSAREENLRKASPSAEPILSPCSILTEYYIKGRKTFSAIHTPHSK